MPEEIGIALNAMEIGEAPEWITLVPAGEVVRGIDGRVFANPGAEVLLAEQNRRGLKAPLDIGHSTYWRDDKAPAHGWIEEFDARDGALMGRLVLNARGDAAVKAREYRYYSPAYIVSRGVADETRTIRAVESVGLCNVPNLGSMAALNNAQREGNMKEIAKTLGLPETATEAEIVAAIKGREENTPGRLGDQVDMVPKGDLDAALQRAVTAEQKLQDTEKETLAAEAKSVVAEGVKSGVIAPANEQFWLGLCADREGLNRVREHLKSAPKIVSDAPAAPAGDPPKGGETETDEEREVMASMGFDDDRKDGQKEAQS